MTDKQWIARFRQHAKMIYETTQINVNESKEDGVKRREELEADPEKWFQYYFPAYAYAEPAPFQKEATKRVLANREWYEVRIWSRELAKSTRTMMEVFYLTLVGHGSDPPADRHPRRYVLLISNSLDNATRLLAPYRLNFEYNQRIIQDYGEQQGTAKWTELEFFTMNGTAFRALGAGQSPRGARNEEARPDIILFDDIDTDADCLNPEIIAKKWRWIEEAAIGTRSVSEDTTIIFCGNRIAVDCCIERASKLADHHETINIRDEDGFSVWPQKNAEAHIDRVLAQKSYAAQQKEYFNNPITEGSVFKQMAYKPVRQLSEYDMIVCYTDPSYKTTNDYKATVLVGKWQNEYHIIKCFLAPATTAEMIDWHYTIMDIVATVEQACCYYFMEQVFMQDVLVKEVSDAGVRTKRAIPISGDTRRKPDKFMRIESLLEPLHRNGQLYLNEHERKNPHMARLAEQFTAFAPGSRAHDDGPDAVEGAVWKINELLLRKNTGGISVAKRPPSKNRW